MLFEPIELKDKHPSYLTENDIAELQKVKWLGEHYKSVFNMYIETGMRLQEPFWGKIKKGEKHNWFFIKGEHTKNGYDKTVRILSHHINTIKDLQKKSEFVKITKAGFYESTVHNVDQIKK